MIPKLEMADLILTKSDSMISKMIQIFERRQTGASRVSHAVLALGPFNSTPAVIEQLTWMSINPLKKYEGERIVIYRNMEWPHTTKHNICVEMMKLMNQPYGFLKIPLNALDCIFKTFWFTQKFGISHFFQCMQAIAYAGYKATGQDDVYGCGWRSVTPDLADDYCRENWKIVYDAL